MPPPSSMHVHRMFGAAAFSDRRQPHFGAVRNTSPTCGRCIRYVASPLALTEPLTFARLNGGFLPYGSAVTVGCAVGFGPDADGDGDGTAVVAGAPGVLPAIGSARFISGTTSTASVTSSTANAITPPSSVQRGPRFATADESPGRPGDTPQPGAGAAGA